MIAGRGNKLNQGAGECEKEDFLLLQTVHKGQNSVCQRRVRQNYYLPPRVMSKKTIGFGSCGEEAAIIPPMASTHGKKRGR